VKEQFCGRWHHLSASTFDNQVIMSIVSSTRGPAMQSSAKTILLKPETPYVIVFTNDGMRLYDLYETDMETPTS